MATRMRMSKPMKMGGGWGNKNALGQHTGNKNFTAVGKSSRQEMLPSRHALAKLTGGSPAERTMSMYAKATPSGAGALDTYAAIEAMGPKGIKIG